jgi:hypothetical protein
MKRDANRFVQERRNYSFCTIITQGDVDRWNDPKKSQGSLLSNAHHLTISHVLQELLSLSGCALSLLAVELKKERGSEELRCALPSLPVAIHSVPDRLNTRPLRAVPGASTALPRLLTLISHHQDSLYILRARLEAFESWTFVVEESYPT